MNFSRHTSTSSARNSARALGLPSPNSYSPGTLSDIIQFLNNFTTKENTIEPFK